MMAHTMFLVSNMQIHAIMLPLSPLPSHSSLTGSGRSLDDLDELLQALKGMRNQMGAMFGVRPQPPKFVIPKNAVLVPRFTKKEIEESRERLVEKHYYTVAKMVVLS